MAIDCISVNDPSFPIVNRSESNDHVYSKSKHSKLPSTSYLQINFTQYAIDLFAPAAHIFVLCHIKQVFSQFKCKYLLEPDPTYLFAFLSFVFPPPPPLEPRFYMEKNS